MIRLLSPSLVLVSTIAFAAERPNVVVILADDQGWGDLGLHGNTNLKTPHLDSIATDGARFDRFFVQPVCSPTRAEFLTGRYHPRGGVVGVSTGGERLNLDERTLAEAFQKAGYATGCFGKWHNGTQYPYHPRGRGFDEFYGFTSGHWADYFDPPLDHNGTDVKGTGFITDDLATHGIAFMKDAEKAGKPFFCYLAFNTPHSPMQVPDEDWKRFEHADLKLRGAGAKENLNHTRAALAMVENLDANVGRVLAALKESNTIVVYFSDNGPNGVRWNGGMKGIKGSTDEGGVRSPLHVRCPGVIKPGTVIPTIAGAIDLAPTLLSMTGVKGVNTKPFDGIDLLQLLKGEKPTSAERILFQKWNGKVSARSQQFRFDDAGKLFDMIADPNQTRAVNAEKPDEVKRHSEAVTKWKADVGLGTAPPSRPYTVGYAAFPRSLLPARDGIPHGGVKRSANAPNCSFFTNWTTPQDKMTWSIEVATAGNYEAILHYTCPESAVGSELALQCGTTSWTGTLAVGHDPKVRGAERDRVVRAGESYMKDFKRLSLGVQSLSAGKGELTLTATEVKGKTVADVRMVELILKP
ncbi:arylsulfatase [soil metagenome]